MTIDLSHWRFIERITVGQAGLLIAGVDPYNVQAATKADIARAQTFGLAIAQAVDRAYRYAWELFGQRPYDDDDLLTPDIWEASGTFEDYLPSIEMRGSVGNVVSDPDNAALLVSTDPQFTETVIGHELTRWMKDNDMFSQYPFAENQWIVVRDNTDTPEDQPMPGPLLTLENNQANAAENPLSLTHKTKLLGELEAAKDKFWTLYDPEDPTTAPTNKQIVEFLRGRGVSTRSAEAIATILRADDLPSGPRK